MLLREPPLNFLPRPNARADTRLAAATASRAGWTQLVKPPLTPRRRIQWLYFISMSQSR